jgi:hypothetical protein
MAKALEAAATGTKPAAGKRLVGCGSILVCLSLLGLIGLAAAWIYSTQHADERLAVQVAKVRARGEPLTTVELNDYYQPAQNRPDMTKEIIAALAVCDAPDLKSLAVKLPIVGQDEEPPLPPQAWTRLEEVEAFLEQQTSALETFRNLALRDGTARFPVDFTPGIATLIPQTQSLRHASRIVSLQFYVHLHRGRMGDAVECVVDQLALARALDQEPLLISQLVRIALLSVANSHAKQAVQCADLSDSDIVRLQEALRKIEYESCFQRALAGERTISYTACLDPQQAAGATGMTPAPARLLSTRTPARVADGAMILEMNLRISDAAAKSLYEALQESTRAEAEVKGLSRGVWNRMSYAMTILLSPAYRQATTAFVRAVAKRDTADVALAAELYRRRHGKWPDKIEQLIPGFLPVAPIDYFCNGPLKMVSAADELKVYSVGSDGVDNNGNLSHRDEPNSDVGFVIPLRRDSSR